MTVDRYELRILVPAHLYARLKNVSRSPHVLAAGIIADYAEDLPDPTPREPAVKGPKRSREELLLASVRHHHAHGRTVEEIAVRTGHPTGQIRTILAQLNAGRPDLALQTAAITIPERNHT